MVKLVYLRTKPIIGALANELLKLYGIDIPKNVPIGEGLHLHHRGFGVVLNSRSRIGRDVHLYPGVVLGRGDAYRPVEQTDMELIEIGDHVHLFPGAKVIGGKGITTVAEGTLVAANAVLTTSTGPWEVWAGIPARKVADRDPATGEIIRA